MCPACIAGAALIVAGAGSTGGLFAARAGKLKKFFRANHLNIFHKRKEN